MKHADGCYVDNKYKMKRVIQFLSTFNFNIWFVHILQLQQHISLAWCQSAAISLRLQGKLSFPYNCQKMNGQIYVLLC